MADDNPFLAKKANPFMQAAPAADMQSNIQPGAFHSPQDALLGGNSQTPAPVSAQQPPDNPWGSLNFDQYKKSTADVESRGGTVPDRAGSQYHGTYQMGPGWGGEGTDDERFERGTKTNYDTLKNALGRDPAPHELYLAHQQGAAGALSMIQNPDAPAGSLVPAHHIAANGGDPNAPASAFIKKWEPRFTASTSAPSAPAPGVRNSTQTSDNPFLAKKPNPFLQAQPAGKPEEGWLNKRVTEAAEPIAEQVKKGWSQITSTDPKERGFLNTGKGLANIAGAALGIGGAGLTMGNKAVGDVIAGTANKLGINPTTPAGHKFVDSSAIQSALGQAEMAARPTAGAGGMTGTPRATTIPGAETPPSAGPVKDLGINPSTVKPEDTMQSPAARVGLSRGVEPEAPYATTEAAGDAGILNTPKNPFFDKPSRPDVISGPQGTHAPAELPEEPRPATPAEVNAIGNLHTDKTMRQVGNIMSTAQGAPHEIPFEDMRYIIGPDGKTHWGDSRTFDHNAMADAAGYAGGDKQAVLGGTLKPEEFAAARAQFKTTEDFHDWLKANALPGNMNKTPMKSPDEILPIPQDVGAAHTPAADLNMSVADLDSLNRRLSEHPAELGRASNDMLHFLNDDPYLKDPAQSDRMSGLVDSRNIGAMSQEERAVYDRYYKPVQEANEAMHGELTAIARRSLGMTPEEANEFAGYQKGSLPRLSKQYTKFWDEMTQKADLLTGDQLADTLRETPTMHETDYDTMVNNQTGERVVVKKGTGYVNSVKDGQRWNLEGDFSYGKQATAEDGSGWHLERGTGAEIEEQLGKKHGEMYDHNIARQLGYTNATLKWKLASARLVQALKNDPKVGLQHYPGDHMPSQWKALQKREIRYPGLKNYAAPKRVAEIFDDYSPSQFNDSNWYRNIAKISRRLTQSVFWQPFGHILNTAQLALQNTGWHSLNPARWPESVGDLGRAWKDTAAGGSRWHDWEKVPGAALESMRGKNRVLTRQYMKAVAEHMKADPAGTGLGAWAKQLGVQPKQLYDAWYNKSSDMLWNGSDVMTLWRLERNLKDVNGRAGRAPRDWAGAAEAVKMTHKDVPDYYMPARLWEGPGGRAASQVLRFTPLNVFGRYHYNVASGLLQIAKDMVGPNASTADRLMAGGKVINLGLMMIAQHMANNMYQTITGDKKHEFSSHGSLSILNTAKNIKEGKAYNAGDIGRTVGVSEAPAAQALIELGSFLSNQHGSDVFGRPILNPGDTPGRHALQMADWAANKFPPWQMFANEIPKAANPANAMLDIIPGMTRTKMDQKRANQLSGGVPGTGRIESWVTGSPYGKKRNLTKHRKLRPEE